MRPFPPGRNSQTGGLTINATRKRTPQTQFGVALIYEMKAHDLTQAAVAKRSGVAQAAVNQLCLMDKRPAAESLARLTAPGAWPDPATAARLLIAHLRDEIARGGHTPDHYEIEPIPPGTHADLLRDFALVKREALLDDAHAALVRDHATLIRRAQSRGPAAAPLRYPTSGVQDLRVASPGPGAYTPAPE